MRTPELRYARQAVVFAYLAVVLGAVAGLVSVRGAPGWVPWAAAGLAVTGLVSGGLGKVAELRERRARLCREWRDHVGARLSVPVSRIDRLSDSELGATPTRYTTSGADPYVARPAVDAELDELLVLGPPFPFVLVHGDAKAGKSRTVAEALRRRRSSAMVALPRDGEALAALSRVEPPLTADVVVLDDVSPTDLEHLSGAVLDHWCARAVVVATMTTTRYRDVLRTGSDVPGVARTGLYRARVVELPFELTESEQAAAQECYPDEEFTGDGTVSIGEVLVGGEELIRKLRAGRDECPAGVAVARAAIDARRAGLRRPVLERELRQLFPPYLRQVRRGLAATDDLFAEGVAWAAAPVTSQVAILREPVSGAWVPLDYLVEAEADRPVPAFLWHALLDMAAPFDMAGISFAATMAGRHETSRAAAERALEYQPHAPLGALLLAEQLHDEPDRAIPLYRRAMTAEHTELTARAAIHLGVLLSEVGEFEEAEVLLEHEIGCGVAELAVAAAYNLGVIRRERGDLPGAMAAYRQAIRFPDLPMAADAKNNLAVLHEIRGEWDEAELLVRDVLAHHPDQSGHAWVTMGVIQNSRGDTTSAEESFRMATASADAEVVTKAYANLYALLQHDGDLARLQAFADELVAHERAGANHDACLGTALALWDAPDDGRARTLYRSVIDTCDEDLRPRVALGAGMYLSHAGDEEAAEAMFRIAADSAHPDAAPKACSLLALSHAARDEFDEAIELHRRVLASGHPELVESAQELWLLLLGQGRVDEAGSLLQEMADAGLRDAVLDFAGDLADHVEEDGQHEFADLLRQWVAEHGGSTARPPRSR